MHRSKAPRSRRCMGCGKKLRFGRLVTCRRCFRRDKKKDRQARKAVRRMPR